MASYTKKYQDILGLNDFPKRLTTLVRKTRLVSHPIKNTSFKEWSLIDVLVQVTPACIQALPKNSQKEYPLNLVRPPTITIAPEGFTLKMHSAPLITHANPLGESSPDMQEFISDNLYVLEKILVPLPDPTKPNYPPEEPKKLSHAIMLGLDHSTEFPINYMVITMGRKNGPSNLASIHYRNSEGELVITSTEKLFQASKAARVQNMDKVMEILNADNGLKAKIMANAKNLPMTDEQLYAWAAHSLKVLLQAKMCCLGDCAFFQWFTELSAFTKQHKIPEILFLEVGGDDEMQYTCGMMGDKIMDLLKEGEYITLYNEYGPKQDSLLKEWNSAGVMMMKLFEFFKEGEKQGLSCDDWAELMNLETLFPLLLQSDSPVGMARTFSMAQ